MQVRSWMAALVFTANVMSTTALESRAEDPTAVAGRANQAPATRGKPRPKEGAKPTSSVSPRRIELNLMIAGLGRGGCDIEVKPGTRGCRFQPQSRHVGPQGQATLVFRDMEFRDADHTCSFAITVRESGQAPRTIYRGFRMPTRPEANRPPSMVQSFTCFMTSPSRLAALDRESPVRR